MYNIAIFLGKEGNREKIDIFIRIRKKMFRWVPRD